LSALGASIKTTQRTIPIEQFYTPVFPGNILRPDEIITEVQLPALPQGAKAKYSKFSIRKSLDHPLVSVARLACGKKVKVVIGGVFIVPYVAGNVADLLSGKEISEDLAKQAGEVAAQNATPMSMNAWKVQVMRTMVKRAILALI
jgi:CO/xanthine dehydrogenase FAD-binding subunit